MGNLMLLSILASILLLASAISSPSYTSKSGFHVSLTHVDADQNISQLELIKRAINRDKERLQKFSVMATKSLNKGIQAPVQYSGGGGYIMNISIGTPAVPYLAQIDTGSDLIWTQCKPCRNCFQQPIPIFDPSKSSSFSTISCSSDLCEGMSMSRCGAGGECQYVYGYADESKSEGILARDTFTFVQNVSVANVSFGCGLDNQGIGLNQAAGLMGLGRGPLSLVSQLGLKKFSQCFNSLGDRTPGKLLFGSLADANFSGGPTNETPLLRNPFRPSFYYVDLEGITVGDTLLPIPKSSIALGEYGSGGLVVDSGTTLTYLQKEAYELVRNEFVSQMKLPVTTSATSGLDLCFDLPSPNETLVTVPKLIFHLKGLNIKWPGRDSMLADPKLRLICLAMSSSQGVSILGNIQQQNLLIIYDLEKETMSVTPTQCNQL